VLTATASNYFLFISFRTRSNLASETFLSEKHAKCPARYVSVVCRTGAIRIGNGIAAAPRTPKEEREDCEKFFERHMKDR
jgi:hypothetical protein